MKKVEIVLIVIQLVATVTVAIVLASVNYDLKELHTSPFGLDGNYTMLTTQYIGFPDKNELWTIQNKLKVIAKNNRATIILDNDEATGLGLYDGRKTYGPRDIESGKYFSRRDFEHDCHYILLGNGTFANKYAGGNSDSFYSYGKKYLVKGVLKKSNPLLSDTHAYVYSLLSAQNYEGNFYIACKNSERVADEIANVLNGSQMRTEISRPVNRNPSLIECFNYLLQQRFVILMFLGVIFIYFNILLYFIFYLSDKRKTAYIHALFGAGVTRLFCFFSKAVLLCCVIGSLSGVLLFRILSKVLSYCDMRLSKLEYIAVPLILSLATYLIFTAVYFLKGGRELKGSFKK